MPLKSTRGQAPHSKLQQAQGDPVGCKVSRSPANLPQPFKTI